MTTLNDRPATTPERTIGQLVSDASKDVSDLVRYEVALAKAEITADVKKGALGGGLFAGAALFGFVAFLLAAVTVAYALIALFGWSPWLAFLVVTVVWGAIAGVLAVLGLGAVKKIRPPERTIRTSKQTVAAVKAAATGKGANVQTAVPAGPAVSGTPGAVAVSAKH